MRIEGGFNVPASRVMVFEKITDPAVMAVCIPGCEEIEVVSPTCYRAKVKVAVGPISARFNLVVDITHQDAPMVVLSTTKGEEGTRASIVSAENELRLEEVEGGTTDVQYVSVVSITGRLGKFGLGVMKKKADALSAQFAENFRQHFYTEAVT